MARINPPAPGQIEWAEPLNLALLQLNEQTIVDGNVVGDDLILISVDETEHNVGNVRGPQGDQGDPGPPGAGSVSTVNGDPGPDVILGPEDVGGSASPTAGTTPIRGAGGSLPGIGAPVDDSDATSKSYVDAADATKRDIVTGNNRVYITDGSGNQSSEALASGATADSIARRGAGGTLVGGTPTAGTHLTTKTYVDAATTGLKKSVSATVSGTVSTAGSTITVPVTFPAGFFSSAPVVQVTMVATSPSAVSASVNAVTASGCDVMITRTTTGAVTAYYTAIER